MTVAVVLNNLSDGYSEEVIIENVENRTCFSYTDNDKNNNKNENKIFHITNYFY